MMKNTLVKLHIGSKYLRLLALTLACILLFLAIQNLLVPKYMGSVTEGAMIAEYYEEEKNPVTAEHDLIILGDCEAYENISTVELWENYGIHSYIRGSAKQTIWQSYYLLEETLQYETPKVVILSVFAMQYDEPQSEAYNRMTLDGMKLSLSKLAAVEASVTEEESIISYLFPILRYHDRWKNLEKEDFIYYFEKRAVTINGYQRHEEVKPLSEFPEARPLGDYRFGENAYKYLDRIRELCQEKGITLILLKAPSAYPYWYDEWEEQMQDYASAFQLTYLSNLQEVDKANIDPEWDYYDGGLHLNDRGARKVADYIADILSDKGLVSDRRINNELCSIWDQRVKE